MADQAQIDALIKRLSRRMGMSEDELRSTVEGSSYRKLLNKLPDDKARQMEELLGDEKKAHEFLNSPQAQAIIKRIMG